MSGCVLRQLKAKADLTIREGAALSLERFAGIMMDKQLGGRSRGDAETKRANTCRGVCVDMERNRSRGLCLNTVLVRWMVGSCSMQEVLRHCVQSFC